MFGKKKKQQEEVKKQNIHIQTIPDIFYGGQDPEIYHRHVEDTTDADRQLDSKSKNKKTRGPKIKHSHKKLYWIGGIVLGVLILGGISWYYVQDAYKNTNPTPTDEQKPKVVADKEPVMEEKTDVMKEEKTPSTTEKTTEEEIKTPSVMSTFIEFPAISYLNTADLDSDDLTDIEEELFNTDSGAWDTDEDKYFDGQECVVEGF